MLTLISDGGIKGDLSFSPFSHYTKSRFLLCNRSARIQAFPRIWGARSAAGRPGPAWSLRPGGGGCCRQWTSKQEAGDNVQQGWAPLQGDQRALCRQRHFKTEALPSRPGPHRGGRWGGGRGRGPGVRARSRGCGGVHGRAPAVSPPAVDDAAEEAAAAARSGGLKRRPAATGRRRDELGGRPRLGAVRGSGPGGGGGGAAGGPRSSLAAAVAMRGTARPGPPGQGRLPRARGLRAPPPPLLLLLALLPLLPAPGSAAAPAPRPPALPPSAAGPSVSLYLSEDEVRRLIGEWGRLRPGGPGGPRLLPAAGGPVRAPWTAGGSPPVPGAPHPVPRPGAPRARPLPAVLAGRCGPCPVSLPASPLRSRCPAAKGPGDPSAAAKDPDPPQSSLFGPSPYSLESSAPTAFLPCRSKFL